MKLLKRQISQARGLTLIELMIVVAVVGILGAIGGVAYMKNIKQAKVGKLKQYAMELASAQEQYKSQNSAYLSNEGDQDGTVMQYDETSDGGVWKQLLGFNKQGLADQGIVVQMAAGDGDAACNICGSNAPNFEGIWFAVQITQDMNPSVSGETTVIYHPELPEPIVLNEGD